MTNRLRSAYFMLGLGAICTIVMVGMICSHAERMKELEIEMASINAAPTQTVVPLKKEESVLSDTIAKAKKFAHW